MTDGKETIFVTGSAGFIGFHLSRKLLYSGYHVVGIDNLNPYYDVGLKKARLQLLNPHENFSFIQGDIQDMPVLKEIFKEHNITRICNLAAQAGVRHSLKDPFSYQKSNIEGFLNLLEMARDVQVTNFVYASSSSVYGKNKKTPYSVEDRVDNPISLYAATKKANELMGPCLQPPLRHPLHGVKVFHRLRPLGPGRIWPFFCLRMPSSTTDPSTFSITGICGGISPISMISWPGR